MYLSRSQLCRKSTPQVMPDQTTFNRKTERNSRSLTGLLETISERVLIYSSVITVKDKSLFPVLHNPS